MLSNVVQVATLVGVLLAAAGVFFAVYVYRRQMNAQLFLEFTRRYDDILRSFPDEGRVLRLDLEQAPPPESAELRMAVLRYLNLCSEEYYLCRRKYLAKDIWRIWERELERTLQSPLLRREWEELSQEFRAFDDFRSFVDRVQAK